MTGAARAGIALAAACFVLGATSTALARSKKHHHSEHKSHHQASHGDIARGKRHLKKANALAGEANCAAAIAEYTLAYELLNDPVVLFNRAECYRRVEENEKAADDYHAFLDKVPSAPNRIAIEKKLLALEAPEPAQREKPAEAPPPAKVVEAPTPPVKVAPPPAKVVAAPPPPVKALPPPPKVAETAPPPPPLAPPPAPAPAPTSESKPEAAVVVRQPAARDEAAPASGSRPWVWVALSVLAVGAGAAGYFVFRAHDQPPPETALGNYRF